MGLMLIVQSTTGVTYETQCNGTSCSQRTAEGFLIPISSSEGAQNLYDWFQSYGDTCNDMGKFWDPQAAQKVEQLSALMRNIRCWYSDPNGKCKPHHLELDVTRMSECVQAWIPVITPYGPAILTSRNSD